MNHPNENQLITFASGRTTQDESLEVEAHLRICAECQGIVQAHLNLIVALARSDDVAPIPEAWEERFPERNRAANPAALSAWRPALTQRLRMLLHAKPLLDLLTWDLQREVNSRHYAALTLAMRVFDLIVESSGLGFDADSRSVAQAIKPLLLEMDHLHGLEANDDLHAEFTKRLLGRLRNDDNARRPFEFDYTDFESGRAIRHTLSLRLLEEHFAPDERIVLRLSFQAANLFLNALDMDLEDEQAALEAVIQSQLERGHVEKAAQSARDARFRSIQFMEKIERIVQQTRRDLSRVDWRKEVPEELSSALKHVDSRIRIEQHIAHTARDRLDHLEPGSHEALGVAQVAALMDDCFDRHTRLHHTLLQARSVFFVEQSRQRFTPSPTEALPNLFAQVLEPLLSASVSQTLEVLGWGVDRPAGAVAALLGPRPPGVFSLEQLISGLLRPRREAPVYSSVEQKLEWHLNNTEQPHFPEEIRWAAQSHLNIQSVRLSELLEVTANESDVLLEFLGLHGVQAFGSEPGFGWSAEKLDESFRIAGFYGDDLLLSTLESARTDDEPIQGVT